MEVYKHSVDRWYERTQSLSSCFFLALSLQRCVRLLASSVGELLRSSDFDQFDSPLRHYRFNFFFPIVRKVPRQSHTNASSFDTLRPFVRQASRPALQALSAVGTPTRRHGRYAPLSSRDCTYSAQDIARGNGLPEFV